MSFNRNIILLSIMIFLVSTLIPYLFICIRATLIDDPTRLTKWIGFLVLLRVIIMTIGTCTCCVNWDIHNIIEHGEAQTR